MLSETKFNPPEKTRSTRDLVPIIQKTLLVYCAITENKRKTINRRKLRHEGTEEKNTRCSVIFISPTKEKQRNTIIDTTLNGENSGGITIRKQANTSPHTD